MIRLAAGFFGELPLLVGRADTVAVQFSFSPDRLSEVELLDAGHASAGRFVAELLRRVRELYPQAQSCLAFNPRLVLSSVERQAVLWAAALREQGAAAAAESPGCLVFCDRSGKTPLAYLLRSEILGWCPPAHLGLLTGDHSELDRRFLQASCGAAQLVTIESLHRFIEPTAKFHSAVSPALHDFTRRAIARLESAATMAARREMVARSERIALLGYHAGDVLFLLQGLALEAGRHPFTGLVVPPEYADIVQYLSPELRCFVIKQPIPKHGMERGPDEFAILRDYVTQLEAEGVSTEGFFWHPLRPSFHDFARARHHLREMTAFALGGSGHPLRPLPALSPASRRDYALARPQPGRVVVQFDAGWGLKGFPADRRAELLHLLCAAGYKPVVLGPGEPELPEIAAADYTDLAAFRTLLDSAEAIIGCDSFPTHFANLYGVPTLTLFGNTRPSNSRGRDGTRYRVLHHPMTCVPCRQPTRCQLDSGTSCHAMPTAAEVVLALQAMVPSPTMPGYKARPPETLA